MPAAKVTSLWKVTVANMRFFDIHRTWRDWLGIALGAALSAPRGAMSSVAKTHA